MKNVIFILLAGICLLANKFYASPLFTPKHPSWVNCFIITLQGDTVRAQIKNKKDFSAEGSLSPENEISIRLTGGGKKKMSIDTFKELFVLGKDKYLSLNINPSYPGQFRLYRVITDGLCKLLYSQAPGSAGKMIYVANASGQTYSTPMRSITEEYNIYYNNRLSAVYLDDDLNLLARSQNDCAEIFKACPSLALKMSQRKPILTKLPEMIKIFNECVAN